MASTTAEGKAQQPVWVGDIDAVKELTVEMNTLVDYVRDRRITLANENEQERRESLHRRTSRYYDADEFEEALKKEEEEHYRGINEETRLHMTVKYQRWQRTSTGTPEEIFTEGIDVSDVVSIDIELANPRYPLRDTYALAVSLSPSGASAAFKAPEPNFIDMAGTRLKDQFKRQRPWYWWFRASWSTWVVAIPALLASLALALVLLGQNISVLTAALAEVLFAAILISTGIWLLRNVATPFELLKPNAKARGAKKVGAIGAFVVWLISTIAIPIWLATLTPPAG